MPCTMETSIECTPLVRIFNGTLHHCLLHGNPLWAQNLMQKYDLIHSICVESGVADVASGHRVTGKSKLFVLQRKRLPAPPSRVLR